MPFRRRTYRKRRPVFRRRTRKTRTVGTRRVPRLIPLGIPRYRFAKLSYCDVNTATVAATSYTGWGYQSSLFDPYVSVGGHQPMFFDQYAAMYRRYTVMGIAYSLEAVTDQSTNGPLFVTITPSSVGASSTSISIARERAGTKEVVVSHGYKGRVKGYVSVAKVLGVDRRKLLTDDQYSALISANPVQLAYLTFQVFNQTAANITIYLSVRMTYYCRFYDPTDPSQS